MSRALRVAFVAAVLITGCGDDGATTPPSSSNQARVDARIELDVVDEKLVGGIRKESVTQGDQIELVVTGDSSDEVHVHGYDRYIELVDGEGELLFDALIPGRFEIELEGSGQLLIELEVTP